MIEYQAGEGSVRGLAVRFKVSSRTISRHLALVRDTGSFAEREPQSCGPACKLDHDVLRQLYEAQPDAIEDELVVLLEERTGVLVHRSSRQRKTGPAGGAGLAKGFEGGGPCGVGVGDLGAGGSAEVTRAHSNVDHDDPHRSVRM